MEAGREAAHQARTDLERRLAETKAAYNAGADVARAGRPAAPVELEWRRGRRRLSRWRRRRRRGSSHHPHAAAVARHRLGWTLRDYAKRVWDNAGEDNVLFLAGGIAFNILLAAVPFVLLLVWGFALILHKQPVEANQLVVHYLDRVLPAHYESPDAPQHKLIGDILDAHTKLGIWSAVGFVWFSTRLFGSLRTVLASVFDIEQERGIIQGKIFDIKITILSTILITANALISTYVLIATKTSRAGARWSSGIREDVMGQASAWGTHLVGTLLLGVMFFALYKFLPIRRVRTEDGVGRGALHDA